MNKTDSQLCQSCGLCCIGVACNVALVSRADDQLFLAEIPISTLHDAGGDELVLKLPCPVYDGQCSKYAVRPLDCRTYQCRVLKASRQSIKAFEESEVLIALMLQKLKSLQKQFTELNPQRVDVTETNVYSVVSQMYADPALSDASRVQFRRDYSDYFFLLFYRNRHFA
jgi:Fe-S-cluster containining protein